MEQSEMTIDEMNIIIADFDGYYYNASKFYPKNNEIGGWFKEAKYHLSWDKLIPVVKKIKSIRYSDMNLLMESMKATKKMNFGLLDLDLEKTHKGVFEYLQWINTNKPNMIGMK